MGMNEFVKCELLEKKVSELEEENVRLRSAIEWALGEGDSNFGETENRPAGAFWWRKELRTRAFPPKFEEVEVKRWATVNGSGGCINYYLSEESARSNARAYGNELQVVEFTGHYHRPPPPKVKRREEIGEVVNGCGGFEYIENRPHAPKGAKLFIEWEE